MLSITMYVSYRTSSWRYKPTNIIGGAPPCSPQNEVNLCSFITPCCALETTNRCWITKRSWELTDGFISNCTRGSWFIYHVSTYVYMYIYTYKSTWVRIKKRRWPPVTVFIFGKSKLLTFVFADRIPYMQHMGLRLKPV